MSDLVGNPYHLAFMRRFIAHVNSCHCEMLFITFFVEMTPYSGIENFNKNVKIIIYGLHLSFYV